jgi:uncharacterized protein (TIGR03118 family)
MINRHWAAFGVFTIVIAGACSDTTPTANRQPLAVFAETKLIADTAGAAAAVDTNLVNPWGMAFGGTGVLWVSNNHTGTSTLYDSTGVRLTLVVAVHAPDSTARGAPTGVIFNSTPTFVIPSFGKATFIFAGEDGVITAWNGTAGSARVVADRSSDTAVYKGLAQTDSGTVHLLFATDFKHNAVDVFDSTFQFVRSFTDPAIPAGYAPFGIQASGGKLYVTFAKQLGPDSEDDDPGSGHGYVDVFNPDGTVAKRLVSGGALNSPWGVALAGPTFGALSGDLLVGNFGDGHINAYDPTTGQFIESLSDSTGAPLVILGLWGITFGPTPTSPTLFFTAGPGGETHGLLGTIRAK